MTSKYKKSDDDFKNSVNSSFSITQCLKKLDLSPTGSNFTTFYKRLNELNLDISHFKGANGSSNNVSAVKKIKIDIKDILIENSSFRSGLRERLIKEKLLENRCSECNISETWNNKPINLNLDHINRN